MAYDNRRNIYWLGPEHDFGAGGEVWGIQIPYGRGALLLDYGVQGCTEAFAGGTSATIAVGTASNPDAFGEEFPLTGCGDAEGRTIRGTYEDGNALIDTYLVGRFIPAGTGQVKITAVAAGGGAEAGIAQPFCWLQVDD